MADNHHLADGNNDDDDIIFVYTGGEQEVPRDVKRAKIDESIDTIPEGAFSHCEQLIEVEGHNKLKKIEEGAFLRCRRLRRLSKMKGVIEIEGLAFSGCNDLSDLEFDKLEIIGDYAFASCKSLRSINLSSVRRIGVCEFYRCESLTEAVFGKDLERIERSAFLSCTALRRIAIPLKDGLIVEGNNDVFYLCENLSRVDVIGRIQETISSLHLESWRNEMNDEINRISQTLPHTLSSEKGVTIQQWIRSVLRRMENYKAEHRELLKEAMTLLELALWKANLDGETESGVPSQEGARVTRRQIKRARKESYITSGAGIIIKNVLPFLQLS